MARIFISHQSSDDAIALAIARWLEREGWSEDYFLDLDEARGIAPGERWQAALKAAVDRCEAILVLISPAWLASPWCMTEYLVAAQLGKRVFGLIVGPVERDALPATLRSEWQHGDLVHGDARERFEVARPPRVPATTVDLAADGLGRLKVGLQRAGLAAQNFAWPPAHDPGRSPYPGLRAHDVDDAAVFFGRETLIVRALDALRRQRERGIERAFVVLGASGAGKSSFVRAGLWPRLARDEGHFLPLPVLRPDRDALAGSSGLLASLESAFRQARIARSRADLRAALQRPQALADRLRELLAARRDDAGERPPTLVLPVDQAEELFAAEGAAAGARLLELLAPFLCAAPQRSAGLEGIDLLALFAIRSDSIERLQTCAPVLAAGLTIFSLPPLATSEYKSVIEGPAARQTAAGRPLRVSAELSDALVDGLGGADALPLLAFTLERLFVEYGGDAELTLADYQALGGLRGAIEAAVDAAFAEPQRPPEIPADPAQREPLLRALFVPGLAFVDPDTGQRKRRVARQDELPSAAGALLDRLVEARLLVRDRRSLGDDAGVSVVVEVAHEALLRQWPALAAWLDADADALKTLEALRRAAGEWLRNGQRADWLVHAGDRLADADRVLLRPDFQRAADTAQAYLAACRQRALEIRRARDAQELRIEEQSRHVDRQTSLLLATLAGRASDAGHFDRALRLGMLAARDLRAGRSDAAAAAQLARAAQQGRIVALAAGHAGPVHGLAFSPDGARLVTASADGSARLWDAATGLERAALLGHTKPVLTACFSPDGTRVLTASADRTARLWDAASGAPLAVLDKHRSWVYSAVFSPDGRRIVTASGDHRARVWDGQGAALLVTLTGHVQWVNSAAFSPDGTRVLTASVDATACLWDAGTGALQTTLRGHTQWIHSAEFNADGSRIVTASVDGTARVWDAADGTTLAVLQAGPEAVHGARFSPDGTRIVTSAEARHALLWDAANGTRLAILEGHKGNVRAALFDAGGEHLLTAAEDGTARLWEAASGRPLVTLTGHEGAVVCAVFSPDGRRVATGARDHTARVWDVSPSRESVLREGHEGAVHTARFSPDGRLLLTASRSASVRLWQADSATPCGELAGHDDPVLCASFSADGARVVTGSQDETARVWDVSSGATLTVLPGHAGGVRSAVFSPDGAHVLTTCTMDDSPRLWEAASGAELAVLKGHDGQVNAALFSPDGRRAVTAGRDFTARIWALPGGTPLLVLRGHEGWVHVAAFSPDGTRVMTASGDRSARLWDATDGTELLQLRGDGEWMHMAAFSPDGTQLLTLSSGSTEVRLWNIADGCCRQVLHGHERAIQAVAFNVDGSRIVTGADDGMVRVWDSASGCVLAELRGHDAGVRAVSFSPDGKRVASCAEDGSARLWNLPWLAPRATARLLCEICERRLPGALARLTAGDLLEATLLGGRAGEDVCAATRGTGC